MLWLSTLLLGLLKYLDDCIYAGHINEHCLPLYLPSKRIVLKPSIKKLIFKKFT